MKNKLKILWIDDDPKRKTDCENLAIRLNEDAVFLNFRDKDVIAELNRIRSEHEPDLILMDHMLDMVGNGVITTGSSASEIIREKWPECPIICVTGVDQDKIDLHKKSIYEEVISISEFSEFDSLLLSITESFKLLNTKRPNNINELLQILNAPNDDKVRLKAIIPHNLKKNYGDKSLLITISRWVRHVLMRKPGFLYDRLWTATLLGIRIESFAKVEKHFENAKYDGIFFDKENERWWQSKTREILFAKFPESEIFLPWELGRKLHGIKKSDYSVCLVCGKSVPAPETVGYKDDGKKRKIGPMHLRCTVSHPEFEKSLFFEEIRMMKGAK